MHAAPRTTPAPIGAYGLALSGVAAAGLHPAPDGAATLRILRGPAQEAEPERRTTTARATVPYLGGGWAEVERAAREATFLTPAPLGDDELAHPYLSPVASVVARWDGREALHAGAVVGAAGAWVVMAPRGGGKSTTLAALTACGHPLVADDLLVIEDGAVFRGPSFVDLRPDAEARVPLPAAIPRVRAGHRARLQATPADWLTPLAGIVHLDWGPASVRRLGPAERFARLTEQRASGLEATAPERALALAELPGWLVRRRPGSPLAETTDAISTLIG